MTSCYVGGCGGVSCFRVHDDEDPEQPWFVCRRHLQQVVEEQAPTLELGRAAWAAFLHDHPAWPQGAADWNGPPWIALVCGSAPDARSIAQKNS